VTAVSSFEGAVLLAAGHRLERHELQVRIYHNLCTPYDVVALACAGTDSHAPRAEPQLWKLEGQTCHPRRFIGTLQCFGPHALNDNQMLQLERGTSASDDITTSQVVSDMAAAQAAVRIGLIVLTGRPAGAHSLLRRALPGGDAQCR
jgi:hypothetical protein